MSKKNKELKLELRYADRDRLLKRWPWANESVSEATIIDVFSYVPAKQRPAFMEELYRVLAPNAKVTFLQAYYSSGLAVADYGIEWPPVNELSFFFFSKEWREKEGVNRPIRCNFAMEGVGFIWAPEANSRSVEVQQAWLRTQLNTAHKMQIVLKKLA